MSDPSRLVVLAASAGGLPALSHILARLPADFPAAIAIVLHRSPTRESLLAKLLARHCRLPVTEVRTAGVPILPGHVYVAPPDRHLIVGPDARFTLMGGERIRHVRSSANPLFESGAEVFGAGLIAVVLTGGDSDGTDGVQTVHALGGHVIAQDPWSAQARWMPEAAIATGAVNEVLPLDAIAPALVRLTRDGRPAKAVVR